MTYRLLSRGEVRARLSRFGAEYGGDYAPGSERWLGRNGFEFCLSPEDSGLYDEFAVDEAERLSLAPNVPVRG